MYRMTAALNPELVLQLRVQHAALIAQDIRELRLADPDGSELPPFTPGSHLLIQAPGGMTRRYSLTNPPSERAHYQIAVKRDAQGRGGSISMVDDINVGDLVHVSLPRNEFELNENAPSYIFIAGGIGITPIRSMVRHLQNTSGKPFKLFYLTRAPAMTAYLDEFSATDFQSRAVIHHDHGNPDQSFDLWPFLEKPKGAHIYCCGPSVLMDAVRDMTGHWPTSAIHFEDFSARNVAHARDDKPFLVRFGATGELIEVAADQSILEALRSQGHRVPSSCESGTCGSCRMKLLAGVADHRDLVLTDSERQREIMVCVSRAVSPELTIAP
ncbi:MAG: PDR/VanB family oxidoreductase [Betaproteobacteria bacterium]